MLLIQVKEKKVWGKELENKENKVQPKIARKWIFFPKSLTVVLYRENQITWMHRTMCSSDNTKNAIDFLEDFLSLLGIDVRPQVAPRTGQAQVRGGAEGEANAL